MRCNGSSEERLPAIKLVALGGTIAGKGADPTRPTQYEPGVLGVDSLIAAVPEIGKLARVSGVQLANMPSYAMTEADWLRLASVVNGLLSDSDCDGVVVAQGTDTLEETAYFLHLTVKSEKPVVLVGAMRPATAMSADGPLNLYNAVALAASRAAYGQGVLLVMNDRIGSARDTVKTNTTAVDAFRAPELGCLGYMTDGQPFLYYASTRLHTSRTEFDTAGLTALPRVEILYGYGGSGRDLADAAVQAGARGIVHAGMGNGGMAPAMREGLADARRQGVAVVSASHAGSGLVTAKEADLRDGFAASGNLPPRKARILLMLALTVTNRPEEIQRMFDLY
ncbi:L-asparaginase 2 [Paenibacillus sp. J31TS4]|uniref:asparaginase n=1 Tax=Paenibacillus sp. J31TS4 TaxID=2807195 RepID=UPI001B105E49|nr:asparaginase [Paenibacillus sp. J31TS4]GIP40213.1 L-asparaginase 2 [Paenibacillus sp. J31TS4]